MRWRCSVNSGANTESCSDMPAVLVTGAGGFIGGWVVRECLSRNWTVRAAIHQHVPLWLREHERADRLRLVTVDLEDPGQVAAMGLPSEGIRNFDALIHCAGRASDVGWRGRFRRANLEAVQHVGRWVMQQPACRLVFLSTTDVYGLRDFQGEGEESLALGAYPCNPYPWFKIEAERWIRETMPPDRYVILRPAQVWGVGDTTLTRRIVAFLRNSPWIVHFGKWRGGNRWPLAHVRNVATACVLAGTTTAFAGQAIHVLDDEYTTMDDWYRLVAGIYLPGRRYRTITVPMALGAMIGVPVEWISSGLNLAHPFMDPTYYALHAVSRNLDFGNQRLKELFADAGERLVTRSEGLEELRSGLGR